MGPSIYQLPRPEDIWQINQSNITFDKYPNPKLIKYGFNHIAEELDLILLMSNSHYRAGLNFDFERNDSSSFNQRVSKILSIKKPNPIFYELWEIIALFKVLHFEQLIYTNHPDVMKDINTSYQKLAKTNIKQTVTDNAKLKNQSSLIIYRFMDVDVGESVFSEFIIKQLPTLLNIQSINGTMILQISSLQTQIMAEIIYYLTSLYESAYLIKPSVISDLSDNQYLVLINLRQNVKLTMSKYPDKLYLSSLGIDHIPNELSSRIQCVNSFSIPKKYIKYNQIKSYLDTKVYEGATYQTLIDNQDQNTQLWIETFTNLELMKDLLDDSLKKTNEECSSYSKLLEIIN